MGVRPARGAGGSLGPLTQALLLFICFQARVRLLGPGRPEVIVHCGEGEPDEMAHHEPGLLGSQEPSGPDWARGAQGEEVRSGWAL